MKLQPVTLGLVLFATLLGGFVYFSQVRSSSQPETAATQPQKLFSFLEKQVKSFTLKTQLRSLAFARDSQGKWKMLMPDKVVASQPAIAYLLNLLVTASSDRALTAAVADQKEFGFDQPMAVIEVKLDNQETHRLLLGSYDFNRSNVYAQADPGANTTDLKVLLVSPEFDSAVNRALADWKQSATNSAVLTPAGSPNTSAPNTSAPISPDSNTSSTTPNLASPRPSGSAKP